MTEALEAIRFPAPLSSGEITSDTFKLLLERAPDAVFIANVEGRYLYANLAACRLLGCTREEILGKSMGELGAERDPERVARAKALLLAGEVHTSEWKLRRKDGTVVEVEVTASILPSGHWQSFARDISKRKQEEAQLNRGLAEAEAERRWLSAVLDTVPVGVILHRPDGQISFNGRAEDLLGMRLSRGGGSAQYANRVFFPDGAPVPPAQLLSARALGSGVTVAGEEHLVVRPDGSWVPILGSAAAIRDAQGHTIGGVIVFQDMSDHVADERAVRENERLLNGIFELLPVGVWIADKTGRIVRNNPAGHRIWEGARYVGPSDFDQYKGWWLDSGEPIAAEDWALARALEKGETSIGELVRIQCFDGSFKTIRNSALPLHDERGEFSGAIVVNEDISALRNTEEALRRAVRSRDEVLAIVAHDLRSPLTAIKLKIQVWLRTRRNIEPRDRESLAAMDHQIDRMSRLIGDLLDVARLDSGKFSLTRTRVTPAALLDEVAAVHRSQAGESAIELRIARAENLPEVWADRDRLVQVFNNLLGNALKFTGRDGCVTLGATAGADEVRFSVADTGVGIPPEHLAHLFDPFWQGERADRRGTGLGLAIAKGVVEAHGGWIRAESAPGSGTTVIFGIPREAPLKA